MLTCQIRYDCRMSGGTLVQQARRRAGLTQAQLAGRAGTTQSAIARVESGAMATSFDRVQALVAACGFTLEVRIVEPDDDELAALRRNLSLTYDERLMRVTALSNFIRLGRVALHSAI